MGFRDDTARDEAHRGPLAGRVHPTMEQAQIRGADRESCSSRCRIARFPTLAHSEGAASRDCDREIDRRIAFRKSERRQGERLFCRRRSGRDPDAPVKDRRFESDLAYFDTALQKRAGKPG
jgi:hypothetical protein